MNSRSFVSIASKAMFDPSHIGELQREDILWWKQVYPSHGRSPLHALVRLNNTHHAVILKENPGGKMDPVIADRLKHMCGLVPSYAVSVLIPLEVRSSHEYPSEKIPYIMYRAPFTVESRNGQAFLRFVSSCVLGSLEAEDLKSRLASRVFKLELCKIMLFRYLIGSYHTGMDHVIMVGTQLISISETYVGNNKQPQEFIDACVGDWDDPETQEIIEEARQAVTKKFDLDNMRGVILQYGEPSREIVRHRPKRALNIPVKRFAQLVEERLDILRSLAMFDLKLTLGE